MQRANCRAMSDAEERSSASLVLGRDAAIVELVSLAGAALTALVAGIY